MHICAFSINPLFPDKICGGSSKHLYTVALHLAEMGHKLTLLCAQHPESPPRFEWHPNVTIKAILPFKQPFPQPYEIAGYQTAGIFQTVAEHIAQADRFYVHDGELLFPPLYQQIPTVVSLRDHVYPETILGSFLFQGDCLIAIAEYSRQVYLHTAGRFLPELQERCITINNGIDFDKFCPGTPSSEILDFIPIDPNAHMVVLHPHRPEPSKGLMETIQTIDHLVHQQGLTTIRTLVPKWYDVNLSADISRYYQQIEAEIQRRHLSEHFIFHDWVPRHLMPDYYRLGDLTLVLGHFVEAFGNVAYESLACGTPAIVARVATHRSLLPELLINKVDFGDIDQTVHIATQILTQHQRTSPATLAYLKQNFGIEQQMHSYADRILKAKKQPPLKYHFLPITDQTIFKLAPWSYQQRNSDQFYHDFQATFTPMPKLAQLLQKHPLGFSTQEIQSSDITFSDIQAWSDQGYLVPSI